ncbi:MAG: RNA methyltransferase [Pseudomonadota bacterium]
MGENIGAAARAMLNFGVSALRLVAPRDGWPNPKAGAMAAGASFVVDNARVFETVAEATADCAYVLATTARSREILLPVLDPAEAADAMKPRIDEGARCAVLFGGERAGLANDDVMRADAIVTAPVNPAFASINLAQAVLLVAYEWARADGRAIFDSPLDGAAPASKADFDGLVDHLEAELDRAGYFHPAEKKPVMTRNLRAALTRAQFRDGEVRTLRGVVKALARGRGARAHDAQGPDDQGAVEQGGGETGTRDDDS